MRPVCMVLGGGTVALAIQWEGWDRHPVLAVINGLVAAAFLVTGAVLRRDPTQRRNGVLFALAGLAWVAVCLGRWAPEPWSLVGLVAGPVYVLAGVTVLLRYPAERLPHRRERVFVRVMFCWLLLVAGMAAFAPGRIAALADDPSYLLVPGSEGVAPDETADGPSTPNPGAESLADGREPFHVPTLLPPRPEVFGPGAAASPAASDAPSSTPDAGPVALIGDVDRVGGILLEVMFCVLLWLRVRRARGLDRRQLVPVAVAAVAAGIAAGSARAGEWILDAGRQVDVLPLVQSAALLAIPVAFAVSAVRRQLDRAAVADVVVDLSRAPTVEGVRETLRQALRDPTLDVLYWMPEEGYVDAEGRRADLTSSAEAAVHAQRLVVPVADGDGERLALVLTDPSLRRHDRLLKATVCAAALALENTRLQAGIRAQLDQIRASGARILEAGSAERRRLERDLHDGAQQRLLALMMQLGALRCRAPDERTRELVDEARAELRSAVQEIRDLARGLHPAVLSEAGLRPALESVAERLPFPVLLDVPDWRWDAPAETAAYFLVCEALTNAAKHADPTLARVVVRGQGDGLCVEVTDDGSGGAEAGSGSGLTGLRDRIAVLGGRFAIESQPGEGTTISARIPSGDPVPCA